MLTLVPMTFYAQSMNDEQVIKFILAENEKGTSQQQIVTKLLQRGVSTEQLRRVRKKYQQQQQQPGALVAGAAKNELGTSRLRTNRDDIVGGSKTTTREQAKTDMEAEMFELFPLPDSLAIEDNKPKVFGRNIFNNENLTFQPNLNMATPTNYKLGAGDVVFIEVWGASQQTYSETISPDGSVTIPEIGPIRLAGMTVSAANSYLKGKLGQRYADCSIELTVGETRSIIVQVMGEVNVPGSYTMSSLSGAFNALYAAGGINDIGTLRNIKVYRNGHVISTIDVYDYILNGNSKGDVRLQDNDIIVVGPYDCLVCIDGKVKRPMFYEMKTSESVKTLISYAGGFGGDAYRKNVRLIRKTGVQYSVHTVGEFDMGTFNLADGDSLYVDSIIPEFSNSVEIRGAVNHSGMFELGRNISTVRELIAAAEGIRSDAFIKRAVMHRMKEDKTLEVLAVDVEGLLEGKTADIPLRKNDILYIPSSTDMKGERTIKISGEVRYPGEFLYADNTSIEDLVLQAGGLTESASSVRVDVYRRINDPKSTQNNPELTQTFSMTLKDGFVVDGEPGFILQPYDQIVVRKSPTYVNQKNVMVSGAVNFEGQYAMSKIEYSLSDLIKAAGGLTSYAYAKGARLERVMTPEERVQKEATLRSNQIALYEEAMKDQKNYDLTLADSLLNMKLDLGNTYQVAIDLDEAMKHPGSGDDIVLREGDKLIVPQYSNTVNVTGDVMYPVSMNYEPGKSLSYYIKHAGGYGDQARKSRVYAIYMNGSVKQISHLKSKDIEPGCQIVVPSKNKKNKMSTAEILSIGSSSASIAAVVATIANLLKK